LELLHPTWPEWVGDQEWVASHIVEETILEHLPKEL